ncbi:cytochrome P450 [Sporodiniella umbellata]|nr:cytochrome P450 [Sporodiniella umbellata]
MNHLSLDRKIDNVYISLGALATTFLLIKSTSYLLSSKSNRNIPVVPYKVPFLGSTLDYYRNALGFTKKCSEEYGSVFRMHLHGEMVTVVGAEDASEVFMHPDLSFLAGQGEFLGQATANKPSKKETIDINLIKQSIVKHLTPNLEEYNPKSFEVLKKKTESIIGKGTVIPDLTPFIRSLVSQYSARAFVGQELCEDEDLMNAFENSITEIGKEMVPGLFRVIFPTLNKFYMKFVYPHAVSIKKHRLLIKTALEKEIKRNSGNTVPSKDSTLGILTYITDKYSKEEKESPEFLEALTTVVLIFIFVGVHTTSMAASHVVYRLLKHPEYIEALLEEQKEVNANGVPYSPANYRQMVRLDSFIRECLRTRSIGIALPHKNVTQKDVVLRSGAVVHPGEQVYINTYYTHTHDVKDPLEFQGFRFVGQDKVVSKPGLDFMGFGLGKRSCPGRWFAVQQIKAIVSLFLNSYEMTPVGEILVSGVDGYSGNLSGAVRFEKKNLA